MICWTGWGADEADVKMVYDPGDAAPGDRALAFRESIAPVCSPAFAAEHADTLRRPVPEWGCLTFLVLARPRARQCLDFFDDLSRRVEAGA